MQLPISHLSEFQETENEEIHAHLAANSGSHSHDEEEGSHSQGSKGSIGPDGNPVKDLPCPRCQSMNTKFCYYNNYSTSQPRHYCHDCQRYWTVGGTLRNVPPGGSCRKRTTTVPQSSSVPHFHPGTPPSSTLTGSEGESERYQHPGSPPMMAALASMLAHPVTSGFGGFEEQFADLLSFYPTQFSSLLQLAIMQQNQQDMLTSTFPDASILASGLLMPEVFEPSHLELMHMATMLAEMQRMQELARRQAAAWAEYHREGQSAVSSGIHRQSPQNAAAEEAAKNRQYGGSSLHRRPGFWETALRHSRPNKRRTTNPGVPESSNLSKEQGGTRAATNQPLRQEHSS
ncbi:uncharacterized protein [Physcomitrium patens]|uniref:Dof-type domain-containing protein n=1 Tax=Physcomitrium patens TaxID=3218 RepID=A0A2K1J2L8_PHYPA|nr:dof zinc finger protein DOF2.5-like [Physcomitrium patens]PNR35770.1 hypothetical protein PHYPA_021620 [Physcomitrium patens]|eukprot:XP_024401091.1 dof zinc finger protein DOF2.5-like [Physcomitrella patens]